MNRSIFLFLSLCLALGVVARFVVVPRLTNINVDHYDSTDVAISDIAVSAKEAEVQEEPEADLSLTPLPTPTVVKSLYMSACAAGTESFQDHLVTLVEETELNAIVIDAKDYSGTLSFPPVLHEELRSMWEASKCGNKDMKEFLTMLQEKGIYTIARVTVFQDPFYAKANPASAIKYASTGELWADTHGLNYLDPLARDVWERTVAIAEEAHAVGFDEVNYDYIRYPTDGAVSDMHLPITGNARHDLSLEKFFKYLHGEMEERDIVTSADIFGIVVSSPSWQNSVIGQVIERTLPYFDYIAPMTYPSHYPANWKGYQNPNLVPGTIIKLAMADAVARAEAGCRKKQESSEEVTTSGEGGAITEQKKIPSSRDALAKELSEKTCYSPTVYRAWIQDFDYGGNYDAAAVRAQIDAAEASGAGGWMLWDPANKYTPGALKNVD